MIERSTIFRNAFDEFRARDAVSDRITLSVKKALRESVEFQKFLQKPLSEAFSDTSRQETQE